MTKDYVLAFPPVEPRAFELWLQHAAGFRLFEQMRNYARHEIDPMLDITARNAAEKAIDDTLYGLMQLIEGIPAAFQNDTHRLDLELFVRLSRRSDGAEVARMNLAESDGLCMGYHMWRQGDFGSHPVVAEATVRN